MSLEKLKELYNKNKYGPDWYLKKDDGFKTKQILNRIKTDEIVTESKILNNGLIVCEIHKVKNVNIDITQFYPKNMKYLEFSGCTIETLPEIPDSVEYLELENVKFSKFPNHISKNLKELYFKFYFNKSIFDISKMKKLWFLKIDQSYWLENIGKLHDNLKIIDIQYCWKLKYPKKLPENLIWLNISNNNLGHLPDLSNLKKLKWFDFCNNKITSINKELPDNLSYLLFENNEIQSLPVKFPINSIYITFENNKIKEIPDLSNLKKLTFVDFIGNPVEKYQIKKLSKNVEVWNYNQLF
jgi:hypothetical protein